MPLKITLYVYSTEKRKSNSILFIQASASYLLVVFLRGVKSILQRHVASEISKRWTFNGSCSIFIYYTYNKCTMSIMHVIWNITCGLCTRNELKISLAFTYLIRFRSSPFQISTFASFPSLSRQPILAKRLVNYDLTFELKLLTSSINLEKPWSKQKLFTYRCFGKTLIRLLFFSSHSSTLSFASRFHKRKTTCFRRRSLSFAIVISFFNDVTCLLNIWESSLSRTLVLNTWFEFSRISFFYSSECTLIYIFFIIYHNFIATVKFHSK